MQLVKYEAACRALAAAKAVDEVQEVRNQADAIRIYAKQAKNKSLEIDAAEIRIRAERRLGQMLAQQKAGDGLAKPGPKSVVANDQTNSVNSNDRIPTLAEAGISKDLSSRAQKIAAVPESEFEREVADWRDRVSQENKRVTTRLEQAGERAMDDEPEYSELDQLRDDLKAAQQLIVEQERDLDSFAKIASGDSAKLVKALQTEIDDLRAKYNAVCVERNDLIRVNKRLQAKVKRLEKGK